MLMLQMWNPANGASRRRASPGKPPFVRSRSLVLLHAPLEDVPPAVPARAALPVVDPWWRVARDLVAVCVGREAARILDGTGRRERAGA